jgi:hypothetical protein
LQIGLWNSSWPDEEHRLTINDTASRPNWSIEYPFGGKAKVKVVTILVSLLIMKVGF